MNLIKSAWFALWIMKRERVLGRCLVCISFTVTVLINGCYQEPVPALSASLISGKIITLWLSHSFKGNQEAINIE
jgi:hypothetical protein